MLSKSKKTAALLCALCVLAPVPSFAWTHVCLHFVSPYVWFDGKFQVLWGFDEVPPDEKGSLFYPYEHLTASGYNYRYHREPRYLSLIHI